MRPLDEIHKRRFEFMHWLPLLAALLFIALLGAWLLQSQIPRHIVLASGPKDGMYHQYAQRYKAILARHGVTVEERLTNGADENERLLRDPKSGVDVAFIHGGVVRPGEQDNLVMLASIYYEPLWIFYRGTDTLTQLDELRFKRLAIGVPGSGVRAFIEPLLDANGIDGMNTELVSLGNLEAIRALQSGRVGAAFLMGPVALTAIWQALHDQDLKVMDLARADAYPRRFSAITRLSLPSGTVDLEQHIPAEAVRMIGTKAMLVSRDGLSPPIVNLLLDAAREVHGGQGYFEANGEFPNTAQVDLPVSADADRHHRFGPTILQSYLPFFVAAYLERLIVLLVPLLILVVPLSNLLPRLLGWRVRLHIYRRYVELALLERDLASRTGVLPVAQWLADLDLIQHKAEQIKTPARVASEAYTLREHIALVRRAVLAKAKGVEAAHEV
jgi:TRAP-type uncharacterized transport system substrate-binding protein